jgi:hypothetical protein
MAVNRPALGRSRDRNATQVTQPRTVTAAASSATAASVASSAATRHSTGYRIGIWFRLACAARVRADDRRESRSADDRAGQPITQPSGLVRALERDDADDVGDREPIDESGEVAEERRFQGEGRTVIALDPDSQGYLPDGAAGKPLAHRVVAEAEADPQRGCRGGGSALRVRVRAVRNGPDLLGCGRDRLYGDEQEDEPDYRVGRHRDLANPDTAVLGLVSVFQGNGLSRGRHRIGTQCFRA